MGQYKYDFSVVMAVYNVDEYLREAIESLVHQTIGFGRIQLIMVDDGSTDGSGAICDEYKIKYPNNIIVVHKENGGVSSARNAGLEHATGRYWNFMDSDDKFAHDAFEKVFTFFIKHENETDVVSVPMKYFDAWEGDHPQNAKFDLGKRVISLFEHPYITNLSAATSFIKDSSVGHKFFDEQLKIAEDAKFMLSILLDKMTIGLVPDAVYWYRKRKGFSSAIQNSEKTPEYYITSLIHFSNWALNEAEEKYGFIPKFVQNEVMYDLQWKLKQSEVPDDILNDEEREEHKKLLLDTACRIDDEVILQQGSMSDALKTYVLMQKYGKRPSLKKVLAGNNSNDDTGVHSTDNLVGYELWMDDSYLYSASEMRTVLEFIRIDNNNTCIVEGFHQVFGLNDKAVTPALITNGKVGVCEKITRKLKDEKCLGKTISKAIGFRAFVPLSDKSLNLSTAIIVNGDIVQRNNISVGPFFPVAPVYSKAYALIGNRKITLENGSIMICSKPNFIGRLVNETSFISEIWRKNLLGGRKAVCGRLFYHIVRPFIRKKIWIISDRIMKADDNGEALFRYLKDNNPIGVKPVFAISKNSKDHERISEIGRCVDSLSFRHKLMHLICDASISSHADYQTFNPFMGHHDALRDLLQHQQFVFLQHGVTKDDLSNWLNRYNKNIAGFVTSASLEYESIISGEYDYTRGQVWLTGLPRFDRLYGDEKKWVTIMPTWRKYLMGGFDSKTGKWTISGDFGKSTFFSFYKNLINSDRLLDYLDQHGYRLMFFPHPNIQPCIHYFEEDKRVNFLEVSTSYRDIYAFSNIVITDYSSAVFDFAYLRKPVIYCQFDKDVFFSGGHAYTKGYFDYEKDGFGEVTYDLEQTIDTIIDYVDNGCALKDKYRKRIDDFFAFNDRNNCKRVVEKIMDLNRE